MGTQGKVERDTETGTRRILISELLHFTVSTHHMTARRLVPPALGKVISLRTWT